MSPITNDWSKKLYIKKQLAQQTNQKYIWARRVAHFELDGTTTSMTLKLKKKTKQNYQNTPGKLQKSIIALNKLGNSQLHW